MEYEKFENEITTLYKFVHIYCKDNHLNQQKTTQILKYKNHTLSVEKSLCKECNELIKYSFEKLQQCPHEIKPRCRKCPNSCYEKEQWKKVAKLMRYSGLKMGLIKIKRLLKLSK